MVLSQLHSLIRHAQQRGAQVTEEPEDDDFVGGQVEVEVLLHGTNQCQ